MTTINTFCFQCGDELTAAEVNGAHIEALRKRDRAVMSHVRDAFFALEAGNADGAMKALRKAKRVEQVKVEGGE